MRGRQTRSFANALATLREPREPRREREREPGRSKSREGTPSAVARQVLVEEGKQGPGDCTSEPARVVQGPERQAPRRQLERTLSGTLPSGALAFPEHFAGARAAGERCVLAPREPRRPRAVLVTVPPAASPLPGLVDTQSGSDGFRGGLPRVSLPVQMLRLSLVVGGVQSARRCGGASPSRAKPLARGQEEQGSTSSGSPRERESFADAGPVARPGVVDGAGTMFVSASTVHRTASQDGDRSRPAEDRHQSASHGPGGPRPRGHGPHDPWPLATGLSGREADRDWCLFTGSSIDGQARQGPDRARQGLVSHHGTVRLVDRQARDDVRPGSHTGLRA